MPRGSLGCLMMALQTDELVRQALSGDSAALAQLYRHYLNDIYRYIYVHVGTQTNAEDLTSETFLRMVENLPRYRGTGTFRSWLLGIARHVVSDFWRKYYAISEVPLEGLVEWATRLNSDDDPNNDVENSENLRLLMREHLSKLSEHYRRVLELRFLEGKSIQETAQAMNCTESTVKARQHRALKKLAQSITENKFLETHTSGADEDE